MPSWSEIVAEVQKRDTKSGLPYLLSQGGIFLQDIESLTGRNVIAYYSGWLKHNNPETAIQETDKNAFMNAVYGMDRSKGLDLILHTPGGDIAATEGIVTYLQSLFDGDIRAIIPQISMSAGTMIAMSCREIMMGRQSSLGPIDPQIQGFACQMIVDEFYKAVEEVKQNPSSLGLWQTIISKYPIAFITSCQDAIKWSEELAEKWLTRDNPDIDMDKIKKIFINHQHSYSHSRRISREECRMAGLRIAELEKNQDLQEAVLSLHHCYMILMDYAPVLKMVITSGGRSYIQTKLKK